MYCVLPLQVGSSGLTVAAVVAKEKQFIELADQFDFPDKVYFRRTDLTSDGPPSCARFNRIVYRGQPSAAMFVLAFHMVRRGSQTSLYFAAHLLKDKIMFVVFVQPR